MDFPFKSWEEIPVGIYAIAHNEAKFVPRWLESMKEADKIYVYENNNSSDGTYELLCEYAEKEEYKGKLIVFRGEVKPFRFDTARNQGMEQIPVWGELDSVYALWCTDIDELLTPGWANAFRKKIFECKGCFQHILYKYAWNHDEFGNPGRVFWYDKTIINDGGWEWSGAAHEWQSRKKDAPPLKDGNLQIDDGLSIWLHHYPDNTKSRGSYLGLLELRAFRRLREDAAALRLRLGDDRLGFLPGLGDHPFALRLGALYAILPDGGDKILNLLFHYLSLMQKTAEYCTAVIPQKQTRL